MKKTAYLDAEEKDFFESIAHAAKAQGKKPSPAEQKVFKKAARAYMETEAKMNIRIDSQELEKIKEYAAHEGLKYQTFVKSVLHKYITGQLVEKRAR